jgi:hypothetical protein
LEAQAAAGEFAPWAMPEDNSASAAVSPVITPSTPRPNRKRGLSESNAGNEPKRVKHVGPRPQAVSAPILKSASLEDLSTLNERSVVRESFPEREVAATVLPLTAVTTEQPATLYPPPIESSDALPAEIVNEDSFAQQLAKWFQTPEPVSASFQPPTQQLPVGNIQLGSFGPSGFASDAPITTTLESSSDDLQSLLATWEAGDSLAASSSSFPPLETPSQPEADFTLDFSVFNFADVNRPMPSPLEGSHPQPESVAPVSTENFIPQLDIASQLGMTFNTAHTSFPADLLQVQWDLPSSGTQEVLQLPPVDEFGLLKDIMLVHSGQQVDFTSSTEPVVPQPQPSFGMAVAPVVPVVPVQPGLPTVAWDPVLAQPLGLTGVDECATYAHYMAKLAILEQEKQRIHALASRFAPVA